MQTCKFKYNMWPMSQQLIKSSNLLATCSFHSLFLSPFPTCLLSFGVPTCPSLYFPSYKCPYLVAFLLCLNLSLSLQSPEGECPLPFCFILYPDKFLHWYPYYHGLGSPPWVSECPSLTFLLLFCVLTGPDPSLVRLLFFFLHPD